MHDVARDARPAPVDQRVEVARFVDGDAGEVITAEMSDYAPNRPIDQDLANFLARPVKIHTMTWGAAGAVAAGLDPWSLFMTNTVVSQKLKNFSRIRGKLHLKISINSTPFNYGAVMAAYQPLRNDYGNRFDHVFTTQSDRWVQSSQLPHVILYPQTCKGGEIECPFVWYNPYLDISKGGDTSEPVRMGRLRLLSLDTLRTVASEATSPSTIQIFAWLTDVSLFGPTLRTLLDADTDPQPATLQDEIEVEMQSAVTDDRRRAGNVSGRKQEKSAVGNEMDTSQLGASEAQTGGKLSETAGAAGHLATVLGEGTGFSALTTAGHVLGGIGTALGLMGWSNPKNTEAQSQYNPATAPPCAATDHSAPYQTLALSTSTGLTVDPGVAGGGSEDETMLLGIAQRESFFRKFDWSTTSADETHLGDSNSTIQYVNPRTFITRGSVRAYTPMGYLSEAFSFWRGSIIFRFVAVCSQYHRGRLLLTYDSAGHDRRAGKETEFGNENATFYRTWDLAQSHELEVEVPFMSDQNWLATDTIGGRTIEEISNGSLRLSVLNRLTAPLTMSDVSIMVFVRAGHDFMLGAPRNIPHNLVLNDFAYSTLEDAEKPDEVELESLETTLRPSQDEDCTEPIAQVKVEPGVADVNIGELCSSVREYMRRMSLESTTNHAVDLGSQDDAAIWCTLPRFPIVPGAMPGGINVNTVTPPGRRNFAFWTPLSWFSTLFAGHRGSIRHVYRFEVNPIDQFDPQLMVERGRIVRSTATNSPWSTTLNATLNSGFSNILSGSTTFGAAGQALGALSVNPTISVEVPQYEEIMFQSTKYRSPSEGTAFSDAFDDADSVRLLFSGTASPGASNVRFAITRSVGAGEDYSLVQFMCTPTMRIQNPA